jgi:hypothetical protein
MTLIMKNLLLATAIATLTTASMADLSITGKYKGKISEDSTTGNYKYNGDLDLTLKGRAGDTQVTSTFENIGKNDTNAVTVKQAYIETPVVEGIDFKGGTYKSKNGKGLLQENTTKNRMNFSTEMGGFSASVTQVSGDSKQEVTLSTTVGPATITVQNVANDTRFITVQSDLAGVSLLAEVQEASTGKTNMGAQASVSVGTIELTGVYIDVQDGTGVFQTDGIVGDISDANDNSTVTGIVASTGTSFGKVTGKYITKNNLDTVVGKVNIGKWELGASKTENADSVFDASITVKF